MEYYSILSIYSFGLFIILVVVVAIFGFVFAIISFIFLLERSGQCGLLGVNKRVASTRKHSDSKREKKEHNVI